MGYRIDLTNQQFGRWKVIGFDKNKNKQTYWKCKCECGTEKSVNGARLKNGSSKSCGCLSREITAKRSMKDITNQQFGRLTAKYPTNKRDNGKIIWVCECECGNTIEVPVDRLTCNITQSCGCLSKEKTSERFGIDMIGQKVGKLTVIKRDENPPNKKRIYWLCKCDCGNSDLISVSGIDLRNGKKIQCPLCRPRSKGEEQIKEILLINNISFIQEKSFEDCRFPDTNRLARFDFFVENKYLIEFDGRQHIEETSGDCSNWWSLSYVQAHDKIKNDYCQLNNIPLIRIPYSKINFIKIEDLLLDSTKYRIN